MQTQTAQTRTVYTGEAYLTLNQNLIFFFFFDSFGIEEPKNFMIQNDEKVIQKILSGIEKMTRSDNKITLVNIKFSMKTLYLKRFSFILFSHLQISSNSTSL